MISKKLRKRFDSNLRGDTGGFLFQFFNFKWDAKSPAAAIFCSLAMLLGFFSQSIAADGGVSKGKPSGWVATAPLTELAPPLPPTVRDGKYYLLSDIQVRVQGKTKQQYNHYAVRVLNERGMESTANIEIVFDPSYQKLTLHAIRVHRGDAVIAKLNSARVRVLQRERELEYLIFDGRKSASVLLDDVRVGDVVEYDYTIEGVNPVFGGKHFAWFDMQWGAPVERLQLRLLWPKGRNIFFKNFNGAPLPKQNESGEFTEYTWSIQGQSGLQLSRDTPVAYDPYASVQWSEFAGWADVAQWASALYKLPNRISPELKSQVDRIAGDFSDAPARVVETLRYVQKNVRYMGVEVGIGSHAPTDPNIVLARRFGDCKDKAFLVLSMLDALGIKARAAVVNTRLRGGIERLLATPGAFDHVIVQVDLADRSYWIDPTQAVQFGDLRAISQPDYGKALVIDPATMGLTPMFPGEATKYKRVVHSVFEVPKNKDADATYTVKTLLKGASAEAFRANIAKQTIDKLQQDYLNFYAAYYPAIKIAEPFQFGDDQTGNVVTTTEKYLIPNFWVMNDQKSRQEAQIEVPEISAAMRAPRDTKRNSPLRVEHPLEIESVTEIRLPADWSIKPQSKRIADPAFEFNRDITRDASVVVITDTFQTYADTVTVDETARYVDSLSKARSATRYQLYQGGAAPKKEAGRTEGNQWIFWLISVLFVTLYVGRTVIEHRRATMRKTSL
ncbi:MAG: DUF3857 domain-containing transglutaminase family protein [Rhodoferax sp.]|nr:DUF3857 domain-containing transglutaminase family protein [Rhodoferax sp.]